jgi:hypothetical protein
MTTMAMAKQLKIWPKELLLVESNKYQWTKNEGLTDGRSPDMELLINQFSKKKWEKCFPTGFFCGDDAEYALYATESSQIVLLNRNYAHLFTPNEVAIQSDYCGIFKSPFECTYIMGIMLGKDGVSKLNDELSDLVRVLHKPKRI